MAADSRSQASPTNVRWTVFALGAGTSWMLYLHRYSFALIKPKLEKEWNLTADELGWLDSAFGVSYMVFQFPVGVLVDLTGTHLLLGSMIVLWSLAFGLHAWAPGFGWLVCARGGLGAAQAGTFAALTPLTRNWFPLSVRTTVQGMIGTFSGRFGGLCANILFATVLVGSFQFGWRTATWIFAAGGIVLGVAFLLLYRNTPREHPLVNEAEAELIEAGSLPAERSSAAQRPRMTVRQMFAQTHWRGSVNLSMLSVASTCSTAADNVYSSWIPLFLASRHGLDFKEMGIYSALPLLGGAIGGAVGGYLNDWLLRRTGSRRWARSIIGAGGKGTAAAVLLAALALYAYADSLVEAVTWFGLGETAFADGIASLAASTQGNPYVFCGMLFFVKFFADWELASRWGVVTDIGGKASASVSALNNTVASIATTSVPVLYGNVAEHVGWEAVFLIAIGFYVLCSLAYLFVNCTIPVLAADAGPAEESP